MEQNTKKSGNQVVLKICGFIVDKRNLFFLLFGLLIIFSAFSRNWVGVENSMSHYLPSSTETKQGLDLMEEEFVTYGTCNVMIANVSYQQAEQIGERLELLDGVYSVDFDDTEDHYTNGSVYYNITFDYDEKDDACLEVLDAVKAYDNYYIDAVRNDSSNADKYMSETAPTEKDLKPYDAEGNQLSVTWVSALSSSDIINQYKDVALWKHEHTDGTTTDFLNTGDEDQDALDKELQKEALQKASENSSTIQNAADHYANEQYKTYHGGNEYDTDVSDAVQVMYDITIKYTNQMSDSARKDAEAAFDAAKEAAGNMEQAGSETKRIADDVNGRGNIVLPELGDTYRSNTNELSVNLQGISENMEYLNQEMKSAGDVLSDDMEAVNDQFSAIMLLYTDAIDGVLDMDYSGVYEDTSEEDARTSTTATLAQNTNYGTIKGDLNVSGIAGTMAIEYDFDLESDITGMDDAKVNSTYLTKCVLRDNINQADVTAQKSDVGGITGRQELGMILGCENYGRIKSASGEYVGGIAGESLSSIKESYAKCALSGEKYVGGIAGSGYGIEDCYTMVRVLEADAFFGAIAGMTNQTEQVSGNYFVSDELAGIDRISYSDKAEPLNYEALLEKEELPDEFRQMKITFYADEEQIASVSCAYGGSIVKDRFPQIPEKDGFYAAWDTEELKNVVQDEDIYVEYVRYLTTIAGDPVRENGQSVLLADGWFEKEDHLEVCQNNVEELSGLPEGTIEVFTVELPEDGNAVHQLRYQAPDADTKATVYVKSNGEWIAAETDRMGSYYLFQAEGTGVELAIAAAQGNHMIYVVSGIIAAVLLISAGVLLYTRNRRNK